MARYHLVFGQVTQGECVHSYTIRVECVHACITRSECVHSCTTQGERVHSCTSQGERVHSCTSQGECVHSCTSQGECVHSCITRVECVQCVVHGLSVFMGVYVHISPVSVYIHVLHWVSVYFTYSYTRSLEQRNIRTPLGHMYVHIQSFYSNIICHDYASLFEPYCPH